MLRTATSLRDFTKPSATTLAAMSLLLWQSVQAALPEHSVSPSRQFIVYGGDPLLRGAVSQLAERTKSNLLSLLGRPDHWKTVIVINLQTPKANLPEVPPVELRFSQTGFGLKLQLDLTVGTNVDACFFERELLRAILLEMIYRRKPDLPAGAVYVQPPDWMLDGVLALAPGRDRSELIDALAMTTKTVSLREFLQPQPISDLDSTTRALFRAYSYTLVQLLVDLADGRSRLSRYVDNLSTSSNDPLSDLQAQVPALCNDAEARWKSKLAEIKSARKYELLSFAKTGQRLDELLKIGIAGAPPEGVDLGELISRRRLAPTERSGLVQLSRDLSLLTTRAHPLMRPIVREYHEIASLIAGKKWRRLARRLTEVNALRDQVAAHMNKIDDYMNWFEATQLTNKSENFTSYLKAADFGAARSRRRDSLSVYLDALENQL